MASTSISKSNNLSPLYQSLKKYYDKLFEQAKSKSIYLEQLGNHIREIKPEAKLNWEVQDTGDLALHFEIDRIDEILIKCIRNYILENLTNKKKDVTIYCPESDRLTSIRFKVVKLSDQAEQKKSKLISCPGCGDIMMYSQIRNDPKLFCPGCRFEINLDMIGTKVYSKEEFIQQCHIYLYKQRKSGNCFDYGW